MQTCLSLTASPFAVKALVSTDLLTPSELLLPQNKSALNKRNTDERHSLVFFLEVEDAAAAVEMICGIICGNKVLFDVVMVEPASLVCLT